MKRYFWLVVPVMVGALLLDRPPVLAIHTSVFFSPIVSKLHSSTKLAVLLPTYLPESYPIYPTLTKSSANGYVVEIGRAPGCVGGNACEDGYLDGSIDRYGLGSPEFTGSIHIRLLNGTIASYTTDMSHIRLHDGTIASYTPGKCYAFCGPARIAWRKKNAYYEIALKCERGELVRVANSMVGLRHWAPMR